MNEYKLEKLANDYPETISSNETRFFDYEPEGGESLFEIEVNADVVCKLDSFTPDIQYIKVKLGKREFYVGDGLYPFFEAQIELMSKDLDWSF